MNSVLKMLYSVERGRQMAVLEQLNGMDAWNAVFNNVLLQVSPAFSNIHVITKVGVQHDAV